MGIFPGFGGLINQNTQEPPKAENVKSKSRSEIKNTDHEERDEMKEQLKLWRHAEKKEQWEDVPAKVKVETEDGLCHVDMVFTLGLPPQAAYDVLTNPDNQSYSRIINQRHELLDNVSRKVLTDNGSSQTVEAEKAVAWKFLSWSGTIPISLDFVENLYMKRKMMFMKSFEGSWKVEPIYVDSKRLCKQMKPKSREEYHKCSGGQGKIASKVKMNQTFQPSFPFNLPPLSWYIRDITIKITKALIQDLQDMGAKLRGV
ncbi:hypothetical protein ISN44_As01g024000 [Arabidopsis suecica]|uniref:DUF220 domain-containing protein n=2 Tax=Arabidopsis TaxID=3701 RepID=A0A178WKS3_ARATH|nr:hypothetical protein ISN44_As01g024000 [Arabidopsis suecica]OAP18105.1 hypothetical protein AXX17_AT1G24740 [Arabidopsis thaliana]